MSTLSGQLLKGTLKYNVDLVKSVTFDLPENATLTQLAVFEDKIGSAVVSMSAIVEAAYESAFNEPLELSEDLPNVCESAQIAA